ncbi:unnamed protein product [Somion occarium]|uniref:Uncharacterized protein n=1 Tax=Somion occarium TaxID=3059160 RepID=A0ABP1E2W4_9APHY
MPSLSQLSEAAYIHHKPRIQVDEGVQATPDELLAVTPTRPTTPAVKLITKPPTLEPPPALNFESAPIQWKGLTLEAAQWNFSSDQLQDIVSRAIRKSAAESFIRLLSVKTLDEELGPEMERLDHLKATTQSQYRFNMHRRTMLLQSLVALSAGDCDNAALANLTTQLADITRSCDRLMEEMLRISDQRAQIQRIQDVHDASALAMALRKLNGSYAKRTTELRETRVQVESLKAELEEAWRVAEDMAQEMDDLENFQTGFSEPEDEDEVEEGGDDEQYADNDESVRLATVMNITGTAVATKATLTNMAEGSRGRPDNQKESDRASRVSAARKRSSRRSKASLRLPKSSAGPDRQADRSSVLSRRSRSKSVRRGTVSEDSPTAPPLVPPVPNAHLDPPSDSFLIMSETRPASPSSPEPESAPPVPPTSQTRVSDAATDSETESLPDPETVSSLSKRPTTLNFEMPPITISPPEDEDERTRQGEAGQLPDRRVQSMQPAPARTRSMDDVEVGTSPKVARNYKKFDGWPWGMKKKKNKRHSMPMTRNSIEDARKDVQNTSTGSLSQKLLNADTSVKSVP